MKGQKRGQRRIRAARRRRSARRRSQLETLESRLLMAWSVTDFSALSINAIEDKEVDAQVATFRSGVDPSRFVAVMDWGDGLQSPTMIHPETDGSFGVYGIHTYADQGTYNTQVTLYEVDEDTPDSASLGSTANVTDGSGAFTKTTMRAIGQNLELVEGQDYTGVVFKFADTNTSRSATDYSATVTLGGNPATVTLGGDGLYHVTPDAPLNYQAEQAGPLDVTVTAGGETLNGQSSLLVVGAPLTASGRAIDTPYDAQGDPTLALSDLLATFTDDNPYSDAADFRVVVYWGDGEFTENPSGWITKQPDDTYEINGGHTYRTAGTYQIDVHIFEGDHSRAAATSSVTMLQPPGGGLPFTWANIDCHGYDFGQGPPPPGVTSVTDKTVLTFGATVEAVRDASGSFVVGRILAANAESVDVTIDWGDGSPTTSGSVDSNGYITGTHTYTDRGAFSIGVSADVNDHHYVLVQSIPEVVCEWQPRTRNYVFESGATVENPGIAATNIASGSIVAGQSISAGTLFSVSGMVDEAVATIEWGDGAVDVAEIDGAGSVAGSHTFDEPGFYTARLTVRQGHQLSITTAEITVDPASPWQDPLVPLDAGLVVQEHEELDELVLARIRDTNPQHIGGLHLVTIDWGDGAKSRGRIVLDTGAPPDPDGRNVTYLIKGDHTYRDAGVYPLRFEYHDQFDTVTWHGTAVVTAQQIVDNPPLPEHNVGLFQTRTNWQVAGFTTSDVEATADHFRATIDWGDGDVTAGTIQGSGGTFTIGGSHMYDWEGSFQITVFVEDGRTTDQVARLQVPVTVGEITAGINWPWLDVGEYEILWSGLEEDVALAWGDGTPDSNAEAPAPRAADLVYNSAVDLYLFTGRHIYQIDSGAGAPLDLTSKIESVSITRDLEVGDGLFEVTDVRPFVYGEEGSSLGGVKLLTFTKSEFDETGIVAHVDWGDGQQTADLSVSQNADKTFTVEAHHLYDEEGEYPVTVVLESPGGALRRASTRAIVLNTGLVPGADAFAAAEDISTGEVPLVIVPADEWGAPWLGLPPAEADPLRAAFDPDEHFTARIDWGVVAGPTHAVGILRLDPVTDALEVYGVHTYADSGNYTVWVELSDKSPFPW